MPNQLKLSAMREAAVRDLYRHKMARRSFGLPKGPLPDPGNFLRKGNGIQTQEKQLVMASKSCTTGARKPPVPRRNENSSKCLKAELNYVLWNKKLSRSMATPHVKKQRLVDNKDGHTIDIPTSGLVPRYTFKPTFGKVPAYLLKQQPETQYKSTHEDASQLGHTELSTEECPSPRSQSLQELKERWATLEAQLQRVSFARPEKRDAIEDDILLIESSIKQLLSH